MNYVNAVLSNYPTYLSLGGAALCGAGAIEMAARIPKDIAIRDADNLSKDLAGALFYGLCAANIVPYTAVAGAALFTVWSIGTLDERHAYKTMQAVDWTLNKVDKHIAMPLVNHVILPLSEHLIEPLAKTISAIFAAIFSVIQLPENPAWYGVAALVVAAVAYNGIPFVGLIV
jgi:hypothetical protein